MWALCFPTWAYSAAAPQWELIEDLDDILVWQKDTPGTSLVTFRGKGLVDADIFTVFAVLYDVDNKIELLNRCSEYRLLSYEPPNTITAYTLLESPFFLISDRDIIFKTDVEFEPANERIVASFFKADDSLAASPSGVVRAADMRGAWILEPTKNGKTRITYEAVVDPSGMVPHWIVNWTSKWLPHQTIKNMRTEVTRTEAYRKSRLLVKYLFDFRGFLPDDHQAFKRNPEERARFEAELEALERRGRSPKPRSHRELSSHIKR